MRETTEGQKFSQSRKSFSLFEQIFFEKIVLVEFIKKYSSRAKYKMT